MGFAIVGKLDSNFTALRDAAESAVEFAAQLEADRLRARRQGAVHEAGEVIENFRTSDVVPLGGGTDFAAAGAVEGGGQGQLPRLRFLSVDRECHTSYSMKRLRLVNLGSLVKLMPSLRSPDSSPAVGRWLMCISQP